MSGRCVWRGGGGGGGGGGAPRTCSFPPLLLVLLHMSCTVSGCYHPSPALPPSRRHLFTSPDVSIDRARRAATLKERETSAGVWVQGHKKHIASAISDISIISPGYKRKYA